MKVLGTGPAPCAYMVIGPYPGYREDETGVPFSPGKEWTDRWGEKHKRHTSGDELNRFLNGIELPRRSQVYLTNLHKHFHAHDYVYTAADVDAALPELVAELNRVQPDTVITMGREVTRLFLGDVDVQDVQGLPWYCGNTGDVVNRDDCHGITPWTVVFPMVHIAAGIRNSDLSVYVVGGFQGLASYLRKEVKPRWLYDDPYAGKEQYAEITTAEQLAALTAGWNRTTQVAVDTEGWPYDPWSVQFTVDAGTGYLIRASEAGLVHAFSKELQTRRPRLTFHSALHDLAMCRAMGIDISGLTFDDTAVMAYLLQIEPPGLKAGCLRHCNMKMQEYSDVVADKDNELAREYLTWLWDGEQHDYEKRQQEEFDRLTTTPYVDKKGKTKPGRKLRTLPKLPRTPLQRAVSRVLGSSRPHALWLEQIEDIQVAGYARLGRLPYATLDYVPRAVAVSYGCRDTDGTTRLRGEYGRKLDSMALRSTYDLEISTYPLLDRMQQVGILPDLEQFADLSVVLSGEIERLREVLVERTGLATFNANSGDQVAEYLFGTLKLEEMKLTSTGRGSTNDKILEALEHEHPEHPVLSDIRAYREVYKLKHTFVDRIPDFVDRWPYDGRIHTTLRTTRVVTGRLASADPNLLAQPEHGTFADDFKRGWVAGDGRYVYAWDESQIELRGLAHLSQDPVMLAVFRGERRNKDGSPIDLHAALAERIFGVKPKDQSKHKHRLPAKAINFGIPMGMTCRGLSVELRKNGVDADEDTAQRWLDETLGLYKGVAGYMERRIHEARQNGYIRCLSGRIRYIGGIRSRDERVREEAERFAFSTPIQESAQYVMKTAEAYIWRTVLPYFWDRGAWVEPLLQVHDCLRMEGDKDVAQELNVAMRKAMIDVPASLFSVPLDVEGEYGLNLCDVEKFT